MGSHIKEENRATGKGGFFFFIIIFGENTQGREKQIFLKEEFFGKENKHKDFFLREHARENFLGGATLTHQRRIFP